MRVRLTGNTAALLISNVGSAALLFLLSVLIGRALGEEGLGTYAAVLAWIFPLSLAAEFGLSTLITREIAQHPAEAHAYLRATTPLRMGLGITLVLFLLIFAPVLSPDPTIISGLRISAPLIVILPFFGAFTAIFRALQIMWPIASLNLGMLLIQVGLTFIALRTGTSVLIVLSINTLTSAGQLVAAWAIYRARFYQPSIPPFELGSGKLLRQAWPFAVAGVLGALQARVSFIFLEQFAGTTQVGYFAAASRFIEAARMLPNAFFGAIFPVLAALSHNPSALRRLFTRMMLALGLLGLLAGLGITLAALPLLTLTYGPDFAPAIVMLQVLAWALLPALLRAGQTLYWYTQGKEHLTNKITVVVFLLQISLSLWLIPQYGGLGVAWITLIIESVAFVLLLLPFKSQR